LAGQQDLDATVEKFAGGGIMWAYRLRLKPGAATIQSCGKHSGVIEDDKVVWAQEFGKVAKLEVPTVAGGAIKVQHARGGAIRQGFLGDQVVGEMEVEVGNQHAFRL
jgi:hypothetical protein